MAVVKSQFVREFDDIQTRLNRLCGSGLSLQASALDVALGDWSPPADAQETDTELSDQSLLSGRDSDRRHTDAAGSRIDD